MGSKAFPLLGPLLAAIVLLIISSEVAAARDLAQTSFAQENGTIVPWPASNFHAVFRFA
jgi:hypothetical protein